MSAVAEKSTTFPKPFTVEIATKRNCDVVLQSIPGQRMRGAIDGRNGVIDPKTGDESVPTDQAIDMAGFPKTPGQQIKVMPEKRAYTILDPMHGDEELCVRVKRFLEKKRGMSTGDKLDGLPPQHGKLDEHRMKTLCRELLQIVEAGEGKFVDGPEPKLETIEAMPGSFLLQPGLVTPMNMPRYEGECDDYVANLRRTGG